jgi:hypothetical protein
MPVNMDVMVNTFGSDGAWMFIQDEVWSHVKAIEAIMANEHRFSLDEATEYELIPRIEILVFLCDCGGVLDDKLNLADWKSRYLAMYDDQIDEYLRDGEYKEELKRRRRAVIENTFDRLIDQQKLQRWNSPQVDP